MKRDCSFGFLIHPAGLVTYGDILTDFRKSRFCEYGYMAFHVSIRARNIESARRKAISICDNLHRNTSQRYCYTCCSSGAAEKLLSLRSEDDVVVDDNTIMSFDDVPF